VSAFNHMLYLRVPKSWVALIEAAAKAQDSNPSQYVREAIAVSLAQDGFSTASPQREFALVCDGALVEPAVPLSLRPFCGDVIITAWPAPLDTEGYSWWPIETEGEPNDTRPRYRIDGERVVRCWET
jgi:hypothetical protein